MGISKQSEILVLGGNGKTGRRIVQRLRSNGYTVRVGSTSGNPPFNWTEPSTWNTALKGIDVVYVVYSPDIAMPGAPDIIGAFAEQAIAIGARRLVLLSGQRAEVAEESERRIQDSGADWTILRAAWFNQNFDEGFLLGPVRSGRVELPVKDVLEPFIDANDIADAASIVLTNNGYSGNIYELTGPRLLTFGDAVAEIAQVTGNDVRFISILPQTYASILADQGQSPAAIKQLIYLFTELMDGRNAHIENGVQKLLDREPIDFSDYVRRTNATGVWQGS